MSPSKLTVDEVCANYIAGRDNLRDTSLSKLAYDLAPLRERHAKLPVQSLTKAHIDTLVTALVAGGAAGREETSGC